jgi:sugar phosphate isomerase/epimerase
MLFFVDVRFADFCFGFDCGGTDTKNDVALGTGQVDYPAVLKAAQEIGVKHYFIEDESPDVLKQIPQSLKYLSGIEF